MRRVYHWDPELKKIVELTERPSAPARLEISTDSHYSGMKTVEGVDISSRRKRQEYMRARGVTDASDFSPEYYAKQRQEVERFYESNDERKRDVARVLDSMLRSK